MKNLLLLLALPLMFSCGDSLDKEITEEMLEDGYTGKGTHTSVNGNKYVGEYMNGKMHGQGTATFVVGDKPCIYVGEWKDGMRHGQGTWTDTDAGHKYVGEFKYDKFHGQGTSTYSDGYKYEGGFNYGKYHGQGTYTNSNGTIIKKGLWKNYKFVGE